VSAASNALPYVRIPRVLLEVEEQGLFRAEMEYVYFHNSIDFFSAASRPAVDKVISMVLDYVDSEIAAARVVQIPIDVFRDKFDSIVRVLNLESAHHIFRASVEKIGHALDARTGVEIPMGRCHGDLTFSNIMIAADASAIALIDFLDSFIESPVIDIAKLRQDTLFHWTLLMGEKIEDRSRFRQIMQYLDRQIAKRYTTEVWYKNNIELILGMNMLRICPYAKTAAVQQFIVKCIESLRFTDD
jgi:hypothetical protein